MVQIKLIKVFFANLAFTNLYIPHGSDKTFFVDDVCNN